MRRVLLFCLFGWGCTDSNADFQADAGDAVAPDATPSDAHADDGPLLDAAPDAPAACVEGETVFEPCGLNDRGQWTRVCVGGTLAPPGDCADPDACEDDQVEIRQCESGDEQSRGCDLGQWTDWSACAAPPACNPGETQQQRCGLNDRGASERVCSDAGWSSFSECDDPDTCVDGSSTAMSCGPNERGISRIVCIEGAPGPAEDCVDADVCADGEQELQECERGVQSRTCAVGQWGEFGECEGAQECPADTAEERPCGLNLRGSQVRVCEAGQFGPWMACVDPDLCVDGDRLNSECGLNGRGTETRRCNDGQWEVAECEDPDRCVDGLVEDRGCGLNGRGTESRDCRDGAWRPWRCDDPDLCVDGEGEARECGNGGEQLRRCDDGQWPNWGPCEEPVECEDGAVEAEPCGDGGVRERTCADGRYGDWGACRGDHGDDPCDPPQWFLDGPPDISARYAFDTVGHASRYQASCGGDALSGESVLQLTLNAPAQLALEIVEADYDTVIYVRSECAGIETEVDCNDDIGRNDTRSFLLLDLEPGVYSVFVDGFGDESHGTSILEIRNLSPGCQPGEVESEPCNGGTTQRTCQQDGQWGEFGPCEADNRCVPTRVQAECRAVGAQYRTCRLDFHWGDWLECDNRAECAELDCDENACVDRFEENNSFADAARVEPDRYADLSLCAAEDPLDYYTVDLPSPSLLTFRTFAQVDGRLPESRLFVGQDPANSTPIEGDAQAGLIAFTEAGGAHIIEVDGSAGPDLAPYEMQLEIETPRMCEWVDDNEPCEDCIDRLDPNEAPDQAREIELDRWYRGLGICAHLDPEDYYRVEFGDSGRTEVRLDVGGATVGRIDAALFDRDGNPVRVRGVRSDGGVVITSYDVADEAYLVRVSAYLGAGTYSIYVEDPD